MKLFIGKCIQIKTNCLKLIIISFFSVGFFIIPQDGQAQKTDVTGTVLYNPHMSECFQEVPCRDAIDLTQEEDWTPPKAAVNIAVKGGDKVVKTDRQGNYEITVPSPDASLMFMYIGHSRVEVPIEGRNVINIKLLPTPIPVIERLMEQIMPKVTAGERPDIDTLAQKAEVNRETARAMVWLVLGTRPFAEAYPDEYIPDYSFE